MRSMPLTSSKIKALLLVAGMSMHAIATAAPLSMHEVRDPDYGAVLYDVYQDRFYDAAVQLLADLGNGRLSHHRDEAELLLGGMYLSYGVHDEAERIFHRLLGSATTPGIRSRAWFQLARLRYQRGLYDAAHEALAQIREPLPDDLIAEHRRLSAQLMLMRGQYGDAIAALQSAADGQGDQFARYNLSVARRQAGDGEGAERELMTLIARPAPERAIAALQDQSRISLAFQKIRAGDHPGAAELLRQVALDGPFSEQALLGLAWTEISSRRQPQALVPLNILRDRSPALGEVQEGLLLTGHVYEQAGDLVNALAGYQQALHAYQREQASLEDALASLDDGRFIAALLPQLRGDSQGWGWAGELAPEGAAGAHLGNLLARHRFYEALKSLRDLLFLKERLLTWKRELPGYESILREREETYREFLPRLTEFQQQRQAVALLDRAGSLRDELRDIEARDDALRVATEQQRQHAQRIERIEERLAGLAETGSAAGARERLRRMRGLLLWDMDQAFRARLWERRKQLREIDGHLDETQARQESLRQARLATPEVFSEYHARVNEIGQRIAAIEPRVSDAYQRQERALLVLAREELQAQRDRLLLYRDQARFAVARLMDVSSDLGGNQP